MVSFARTPAEESARLWKEHKARNPLPEPEPEPAPANLGPALTLVAAGRCLFRNRAFDVPPVPYLEGVRLVQLQHQRGEAARQADQPEAAAAHLALCRDVAAIAWRLVRPRTATGRLLRRLGLYRNPFRNASEEELGELLDFFLLCRTRGRVRRLLETMVPDGPWM